MMPPPPKGSRLATSPLIDTAPATGLLQAITAISLVPGCMSTVWGGTVQVPHPEAGVEAVLTTTMGSPTEPVEHPDSCAPDQPSGPTLPSKFFTWVRRRV
jgi:hypothetical protein